jgi:phosphate uptake regulator
MLREIINAFRRRDLSSNLAARLGEMLEAGQWMFDQASLVLTRRANWSELADRLYERDRAINRAEQEIREAIVAFFAVRQTGGVLACLVMMSVAKDAERIGDLCKNIFEVGRFYAEPFEHREFFGPLDEVRTAVGGLFEPTRRSFLDDDAPAAKRVIREGRSLSKQCDMFIHQLLGLHGDFRPDEAVAYVLLARHYKRVAGHLSNIATGVVSPIPMMDFPGKGKDPEPAGD